MATVNRTTKNKIKFIDRHKKKITLCLVISFILVLIPILFTPVSSDDFIYITRNPTWSNLTWRYMHWSGRVIADGASLLMLQFPPIVYKLFKAAIWIALIVLISQLPSIFNRSYKWNLKNFIIIFILYWIANPNLGQTSFWTVGFSNYLLTNFFILSYMAVVFKFRDTKLKISHIFIISTLGLFAGNSNENTSIIVVLLTLIFILIEKKKKTFIIGLPFTLLGTLSLLLSPGQHERLQHPGFQLYREQSLFTRLWNYFSSSFFVDTFKSFSWLFVAFIFIAFIYFGKHQIPKKQNIIYSLIFFFSAVISNAAFGASYSFPVAQRAINGALVLFLIALSFFLNDLDYDRSSIYKKSLFYLVVLLCIPFSISYFYATKSVISLLGQFQVREKIILSGKKNNLSRIYIPNYYVGKLYNPSDSIDMFQGNLGDYYDVSPSVGITAFDKDVSFDYGNKKLINSKQFNVNRSLGQNIDLRAINFFQDKRTSNKYCLNLTFNNSLLNAYSPEEYLLFVHVFWKRGNNQGSTMLNADTSLNNELVNEENYIYSLPIGDIRPQDIVTIDTGIYDRTNKSNIVQTKIDIKNFVNN